MGNKLFCPEGEYQSQKVICQQILRRAAECMDGQRQLVAANISDGGEQVLRARYEDLVMPIHLDMVINSLKKTHSSNSMVSVDSRQVERVVWANPRAWGETNKMRIKNIGVALGEPTIYELGDAPHELLDLAPKGVELLNPILVLAYGFKTNYWGSNREVLSGGLYHAAISWLEWNPRPGNIHYGERVCTERMWNDDSARLVGQVAHINVKRSRLAYALEYTARVHPYSGGLAGL